MNVATLGASIRSPVSKVTDVEFGSYRKQYVTPVLLALGGGIGATQYLLGGDTDDSTPEPYAEDTPLTWILGDGMEVSVVAALLSERHRAVSCTDIARLAGVDERDARAQLEALAEYDIVEGVDDDRSYRVNTDHEVVRHLVEMEDALQQQWYAEYDAGERTLS